MKFIPSKNKGTPLEDEANFSGNSMDLIRTASVKSGDSVRVRGEGMARPAGSEMNGGRRHRWGYLAKHFMACVGAIAAAITANIARRLACMITMHQHHHPVILVHQSL